MEIHSLDTLRILDFWNICKTNNFVLIDKNYIKSKDYSNSELLELSNAWDLLYDEFFNKSNDSISRAKFRASKKEKTIEFQIQDLTHNYNFLLELVKKAPYLELDITAQYEQETYKRVKEIKPNIKIKYFEGIEVNLKVIEAHIQGLTNSYNRIQSNKSKAVQKEVDNVYKVVANAESWLERQLNINEMVVNHWLAIQEQVKQKQKASRNGK